MLGISLLEKAILVSKGVMSLPQNRGIRPNGRETLAAVRSFFARRLCRCIAEASAQRENS